MVSLVYLSPRSPEHEELMDYEFINATGYSMTETSYWACVVWLKTGLNTKIMIVLSVFATFALTTALTMIKLALRIAKTLKNCPVTSETVTQHQKRIFTLLLYQVPLITDKETVSADFTHNFHYFSSGDHYIF